MRPSHLRKKPWVRSSPLRCPVDSKVLPPPRKSPCILLANTDKRKEFKRICQPVSSGINWSERCSSPQNHPLLSPSTPHFAHYFETCLCQARVIYRLPRLLWTTRSPHGYSRTGMAAIPLPHILLLPLCRHRYQHGKAAVAPSSGERNKNFGQSRNRTTQPIGRTTIPSIGTSLSFTSCTPASGQKGQHRQGARFTLVPRSAQSPEGVSLISEKEL